MPVLFHTICQRRQLLNNRVIYLIFWQFITNKRKFCSQDWIILFLIIFLFIYLIPCNVFCFMFFYSDKILLIVDILKILKIWKQKLAVFDIFLIHGWKKCSKVVELFLTKNTLGKGKNANQGAIFCLKKLILLLPKLISLPNRLWI